MTLPGMPGNKKIGWSATGTLHTGNHIEQVTLQADFPIAETYVVEFSKIDNLASNLPIRSEAVITWSVEGNSVKRRVSIANGATVQGVAQAVRVVIVDTTTANPDDPAPPTPNNSPYSVSVQVTPGTRGSNQYPPTLVSSNAWSRILLAAGPSVVNIPIPEDAGVISALVEAIGITAGGFKAVIPGALLIQNMQGINQLSIYDYKGPGELVPIIPGATSLNLALNAVADPALISIQFTLVFGIDG